MFPNIFGPKKDDQTNAGNTGAGEEKTPSTNPSEPKLFTGFVQVKPKAVGTTKPKGFDPFNMAPSATASNKLDMSQNSGNYNIDKEGSENRDIYSGVESLSKLDEGEVTPLSGSGTDPMFEGPKKSAFGFIQKKPTNPQTNEIRPNQGLFFVPNATGFGEGYVDPTQRNQNITGQFDMGLNVEQRPSGESNVSDTLNLQPAKSSVFGFLRKKPTVPSEPDITQTLNQSTKQASITLDGSSNPNEESNLTISDTKSDTNEVKNLSTPPAKSHGPAFLKFKKSPAVTEGTQQNELEVPLPTLEAKSDYQSEKDTGSERGYPKPASGPGFLKFKQKSDSTPQAASAVKRSDEKSQTTINTSSKKIEEDTAVTPTKTSSVKTASPVKATSSVKSSSPTNTSPVGSHKSRVGLKTHTLRIDRVTSPLTAIKTPIVREEEDPTNLNVRLEGERNEMIENIGDLVLRQNELMEKKRSLETQREGISKKMQTVLHQQNEAIEQDNFEEADHFEVVIIGLNESLRDLEKQIDECQLQYTNLEKEKQRLYQSQSLLYKQFILSIENIILNQNHGFEKYKLDISNEQTTEKSYIEDKNKELQHTRNHIDLDLKHLNEESSIVNESLDRQIKDFVVDQKTLGGRKSELQVTIERIKKELKDKEDELATVTTNLNKVDAKISNVQSKFEDQLSKLRKKKEKVDTEEQTYQQDMSKLQEHKDRVEYTQKRLVEFTDEHQKKIEDYSGLKNNFLDASKKLDQENSVREGVLRAYYESLSILTQEKQQLSSCEEEIDKFKENLNQFQEDLKKLANQKNTLANKIPDLEKEKKAFVTSRSFKDASRISSDIKDIQTQITEIEDKLVKIGEKEKQTIQNINTLEKETIPSLSYKVKDNAKTCDVNKYALLKVKEKDLAIIHDHFINQKLFEEASAIEAELIMAQIELGELAAKYPGLLIQSKAQDENENKISTQQEEEVPREEPSNTNIEEKKEETQIETQGPASDDKPDEELVEMSLSEIVTKYDELQASIDVLETLIEQLASEEKFHEADEATNQQERCRTQQTDLIRRLNDQGIASIEEARTKAQDSENKQIEDKSPQRIDEGEGDDIDQGQNTEDVGKEEETTE